MPQFLGWGIPMTELRNMLISKEKAKTLFTPYFLNKTTLVAKNKSKPPSYLIYTLFTLYNNCQSTSKNPFSMSYHRSIRMNILILKSGNYFVSLTPKIYLFTISPQTYESNKDYFAAGAAYPGRFLLRLPKSSTNQIHSRCSLEHKS